MNAFQASYPKLDARVSSLELTSLFILFLPLQFAIHCGYGMEITFSGGITFFMYSWKLVIHFYCSRTMGVTFLRDHYFSLHRFYSNKNRGSYFSTSEVGVLYIFEGASYCSGIWLTTDFWKFSISRNGIISIHKVRGVSKNVEMIMQYRDLYSPSSTLPQTRDYPQARRNYPKTNHKNFVMFQRCIKWQKSWKKGEQMDKKSLFHWEFCMENLKFSQKFHILIGFSPKRAKIGSGFLNFF